MAEVEACLKGLDDPSKTCVYIPPGKRPSRSSSIAQSDYKTDEYELRMQAYRAAWDKCFARVQSILRALHAPVVHEVTERVSQAYSDALPGLPYAELPVVALHGANSSLIADIAHRLDNAASDAVENERPLQVHLHPAECSTVMNMMKCIVTGFVDRKHGIRRKPTTTLAGFDINLLRAWHASQAPQSNLAVFLHEFEKFDANVVQDVLHICSMHAPQLPLVFVLVMSSPPVPSYMHAAFSRSTLALLRVYSTVASSGLALVKNVLTKTFFDPDFDPDVMLGPAALEYISDFAARHTASPDAILTLLQLAYMKHFTSPLSIFAARKQPRQGPHLTEEGLAAAPELQPLVGALQIRLLAATSPTEMSRPPTPSTPRKKEKSVTREEWRVSSPGDLLECVSRARVAFHRQARRIRVAFSVANIAERVALGDSPANGAKTADGRGVKFSSIEMLSSVLRGRAGSQMRYVCMAVRKLSLAKLRELFQQLHTFLWDLQSAEIKREEEGARVWIVTKLNQLPAHADDVEEPADGDLPAVQPPEVKELATALGDWLQEYIEERLVRLDEQALWDVWYTGHAPFPSELVNPAPRPAVVAALLHPHEFARAHAELVRASSLPPPGSSGPDGVGALALSEAQVQTEAEAEVAGWGKGKGKAREPALWELPDTSIAFRRFVEAGRMVNAYDWFESFAVVLEAQRRRLRCRRAGAAPAQQQPQADGKASPGQNGRAGRRMARSEEDMDVDAGGSGGEDEEKHEEEEGTGEEEEMDEEEEERWKAEVQARFVRALQELDYMGFVKHTGRKPDHVIRTIYDVPD
ncbi:origin recognition complex subunit 3 N-terminus-domain-containing protein [Trametes elegans]|nr:origin recognition complex subunit 3 N-terminus-domain-containing protein [Trametes elegans]